MGFELVKELSTELGTRVAKYRSTTSGLTVVFTDVEGPIVKGYFALSSEAFDDDGCPHTLEHLVFLGSEDYPYKGVLDRLANRSLAQGTNAWTDTDNVVFTISTAGSEGFLNILPIYLDHILYCTMTDSGFFTEVHHINDKGEDAGVVYCEMQGRQNTGSDLIHNQVLRCAYPGLCGYKSETGGLMENLRALTVEKIRQFHRDYFRPDNLCLIVTGKIDPAQVFRALEKTEDKIASKGPLPKMERPWFVHPVPPLEESVEKVVEFPDEDESVGQCVIAWRGPHYLEFLERKALYVLLEYLSDSSVSVLGKRLVEVEEPFCSEITHSHYNNLSTLCALNFDNAPTETIGQIKEELFQVLHAHMAEGIDMERMASVIENLRLQHLSSLESSPHESFAHPLLGDFLYGDLRGADLGQCVDDLQAFRTLSGYTSEAWVSLIDKYLVKRPHVCILGKPSAALSARLTTDEKARVEAQRTALGQKKLEELGAQLSEATKKNDMEIPSEIIEAVPIPGVSNIPFIPVVASSGSEPNEVTEHVFKKDALEAFPINTFHVSHVHSEFVELHVYADTSALAPELRKYLPVYLDSFFELPVERDGEVIGYEDVVRRLQRIAMETSTTIGFSGHGFAVGDFGLSVCFYLKCAREKYAECVEILHDFMWNAVFSPERIGVSISKLLNEIPQEKREGLPMARVILKVLNNSPAQSNHLACSIFTQAEFLEQLQSRLEEDFEAVKKDLTALRHALCAPENLIVGVAGNILKVPEPRAPWARHFLPHSRKELSRMELVHPSNLLLTNFGANPANKGVAVNMPTIESSYSMHCTLGPTTFADEDLPAMKVLSEYLTTMEGPFWKQIRGQGLAYSCNITTNPDSGALVFYTYRAPDAFKAFARAKEIVEDLSSGKLKFDANDIEGAKSAVIFSVISREETMFEAAFEVFSAATFKKLPAGHNKRVLEKVKNVTEEDLHRVLHRYVKKIFDPSTSNTVVVSSPAKFKEIAGEFAGAGYRLKELESVDDLPAHLEELQQ